MPEPTILKTLETIGQAIKKFITISVVSVSKVLRPTINSASKQMKIITLNDRSNIEKNLFINFLFADISLFLSILIEIIKQATWMTINITDTNIKIK